MAKRKKSSPKCGDNNVALMIVVAVAAFILGFLIARSYDANAAVYYDSETNWMPGMHGAMPYPVYDQFGNSYWRVLPSEGDKYYQSMHAAPMYEGAKDTTYDMHYNSYLNGGPVMHPVYDQNSNSVWSD